ncbi:MAG: hypothetical protein ACFFD8_03325 [Candidatus Thorarchaeota archaeon]
MEKGQVAQNLIIVGIILSTLSIAYGVFGAGFFARSLFEGSPFYGFVSMGVLLTFIHGYMVLASFVLGVLLPLSILKSITSKQMNFAATLLLVCAITIFVHFGLVSIAALFIIGDQSNLVYLGVLIGAILYTFAGFLIILAKFKNTEN